MFFLRTFQLGLKSLLLHPMRSLLTVLGIFIGVASVIWLLAIGEGISQEAQRQIEGLGADNIIVRSIKPPDEALAGFTRAGHLRPEARRLRQAADQTIPTIEIAAAADPRDSPHLHATAARNVDGRLVGCTPEYFEVTRLELDRGRVLTEADIDGRHNYCVLASGIAERLFPYQDPIGRRDLHCREQRLLRGDRRAEVSHAHRGDRRLAGGPGFLDRRLYPHQHAPPAGRRPGRIPAAAAPSAPRSSS